MLGSNLGKKIGISFVKKKYNEFLHRSDDKKKKKEKEDQPQSVMPASSVMSTSVSTPTVATPPKETPAVKEVPQVDPVYRAPPPGPGSSMSAKKTPAQRREEAKKKGIFVMADDPDMEFSVFEKTNAKQKPAISHAANRKTTWRKRREIKSTTETTIGDKTSYNKIDATKTPTLTDPSASMEVAEEKTAEDKAQSIESTQEAPPPPRSDITFTAPAPTLRTCCDDVLESIDAPEDQLVKCLEDDKSNKEGMLNAEKKITDAAKHLIKVAYKYKAYENTLTKAQNETLIKFFSGKIPYSHDVLRTLDVAFDKTIDFLRATNAKVDNETKDIMDKKKELKMAMFEEIVKSPQFVPKEWTAQFNAFVEEAKKSNQAIDFLKIALFYPKQKAVDDMPADEFGNFKRVNNRNLLVGCLLGPKDQKTIEETKKEGLSKGAFMDGELLRKAVELQKQGADNVSTSSASRSAEMPPVAAPPAAGTPAKEKT